MPKEMATHSTCSCLENPRDGGAWWAAVYGVAQNRTRLKRLSSSSSRTHTSSSKSVYSFFFYLEEKNPLMFLLSDNTCIVNSLMVVDGAGTISEIVQLVPWLSCPPSQLAFWPPAAPGFCTRYTASQVLHVYSGCGLCQSASLVTTILFEFPSSKDLLKYSVC